MVAQVLDKEIVEIFPDSPEIFSINQDDVERLNRLFYDFQNNQAARSAAVSGAALGIGGAVLTAGGAFATTTALSSVRTVAYLVGFSLGSIGVTLWPIVATLVTIAGIFNPATKEECYNYALLQSQIA